MVAIVLLAILSAHDPLPTITSSLPPDTTRRVVTTEVHQESERRHREEEQSQGSRFLNQKTILDRILSRQGDVASHVAAIDSLLRAHAEMRGLVLRELLMPEPLPGFFTFSPPSANEAWRLTGNSTMTAFEKGGLIKKRQMELHDTWTESRIFAPQMDLVATVKWLVEVFR